MVDPLLPGGRAPSSPPPAGPSGLPAPTGGVSRTGARRRDETDLTTRGERPRLPDDRPPVVTHGLTTPAPLSALTAGQTHKELAALERAIGQALRAAGQLGGEDARRLEQLRGELVGLLQHGALRSGEDAERLGRAYLALARALAAAGLDDDATRTAMTRTRDALLAKLGNDLGLELTPRLCAGRLVGITAARRDGQPLDERQRAALAVVHTLIDQSERTAAAPRRLGRTEIALLDLRDALLRRNLELMSPTTPTPWSDGTATEIELFSGAIAAVDQLLAGEVPVPAGVLAGLDSLRAELEGARLPQLSAPEAPAPGSGLDLPGAPRAPGAPEGPSGALTQTNRALLELLGRAPHGVTGGAGTFLAAYSAGMNAVEGALPPPLPFTYTLPFPVVLDDGQGHQFMLAAGTRISSDPNGAYIAQTPGFLLSTGGTTIAAQQGTLRLGGGLDQLSFQAFDLSSGGTTLGLTGMQAGIDRQNQTALIVADQLLLDTTTSHLALTGAQISLSPDATQLGAATLLLEQGGDHLSLEELTLSHTLADGTSTVSLGASNLEALVGTTGLTAEQLSVTFVDGGPGAAASLQLSGSGVHLAVGQTVIDATTAQLQFVHQPDGSAVLGLETGELNVVTGAGTLSTTGQTAVQVTYGPGGVPTGATFAADALGFVDGQGNSLSTTGATMNLAFSPDGQLGGVTAQAGTLALAGDAGQLTATAGELTLDYQDGVLRSALATAGAAAWSGSGQEAAVSDGALGLHFGDQGLLERLEGSAESFTWTGGGTQVTGDQAALSLTFGPGGQLSQVAAQSGATEVTGAFGRVSTAGLATLDAAYAPSGVLQSLALHGDDVTYLSGATSLHLEDGDLGASFDPEGRLATLTASVGQGSFSGDFGSLLLAGGGAFNASFDQGVLTGVAGRVDGLRLSGGQGLLELPHGTVNGSFNPDGSLAELLLHGEGARFSGSALGGQLTDLSFATADARLTAGPTGQVLSFTGTGGALTLAGHTIDIAAVDELRVTAGPDGVITGLDARFPGPVTFDEAGGDLSVRVVDLGGTLRTDPGQLSVSFSEADVLLRSEGLQATLHGGAVTLGERDLHVHVADARLLREVQGQLGLDVTVVGLDLVLRRDAAGALTDLEAAVGDLAAHSESFSVLVHNAEGQQLRLHTRFDGEGNALRSVFLQIPDGGEVLVSSDDLSARFGPMTAELTRADDGALRLNTTGLDVDAVWRDLAVRVDSEAIDVGLDPGRGLVFNHIAGTSIHVASQGYDIDIDVAAMDDLLLRMTGIGGLAEGAMLELVPTGPDSRLTARLSTEHNGIPISLELDDLGALRAGGSVQTNQVHVLLADPTGRGRITATAGPVTLEGSALELFARYRTYDPQRMLGAVGRFLSSDGVQLTRGLSVEADGVVRLGTPGSGLFAETAVLLPRPAGSAPGYLWSAGAPPGEQHDRGGAGVMLNLGGAGTSAAGTRYVGSLFVGAVPGSYLELDRTRGEMSVFGVPLPRRMTVPTTGIAGLNFRAHGPDARVDATLGAFVNPAGLVEGDARRYVDERTPGGVFGGVTYRNDRFSASLEGVVDVSRDRRAELGGVRLTLGWRF